MSATQEATIHSGMAIYNYTVPNNGEILDTVVELVPPAVEQATDLVAQALVDGIETGAIPPGTKGFKVVGVVLSIEDSRGAVFGVDAGAQVDLPSKSESGL